MMHAPDPDAPARRELSRHRRIATGLLALMGGLTLGSFALPAGYWTELLQAAAKAGFVGGIADWFAVTALFRHPLGIPIPHTAIIPTHKERLGRALGRFVATHVFTEQEIAGVLHRLDLPGILHRFLAEPASARPAAEALARAAACASASASNIDSSLRSFSSSTKKGSSPRLHARTALSAPPESTSDPSCDTARHQSSGPELPPKPPPDPSRTRRFCQASASQ